MKTKSKPEKLAHGLIRFVITNNEVSTIPPTVKVAKTTRAAWSQFVEQNYKHSALKPNKAEWTIKVHPNQNRFLS